MLPASCDFTQSLSRDAFSVWRLNAAASKIAGMDVVAVLLGIVMFAILYVLIFGIDRV